MDFKFDELTDNNSSLLSHVSNVPFTRLEEGIKAKLKKLKQPTNTIKIITRTVKSHGFHTRPNQIKLNRKFF